MSYKQSLAFALKTIENCLKADFGNLFASQFKNEDELNEWKKRLWSKMMGCHPQDILDGYEAITDEKTTYLPTIPDLLKYTLEAQKNRIKREKSKKEGEQIARLPKLEPKSDRNRIFSLIREYMGGMDGTETREQKEARMERWRTKVIEHEEMIKKHIGHRKYIVDPTHECNVGHCMKPGVISAATTGNGNYYCAEHYRKAF